MADYGRIECDGLVSWVTERGGEVLPLPDAPWRTPEPVAGARPFDPLELRWLPPVAPGKVICVGRNYRAHAAEHAAEVPKEPLLFLKAPTALLASGEQVLLPPESSRVEVEGELAVVIGRRCRRRPADADPGDVLLGWLCADDVTARDLQRADGQWARGKSFDTFCPVSRLVRTVAPAPGAVLETRLQRGGEAAEVRQRAPLSDMVFSVGRLIAHASAAMTLEPGDLLLTGTPAGVFPVEEDDRVAVSVEGLVPLEHGVTREGAPA